MPKQPKHPMKEEEVEPGRLGISLPAGKPEDEPAGEPGPPVDPTGAPDAVTVPGRREQ